MNVASHEAIRKAQGLCAGCQARARDLNCAICGRSFCAACMRTHGHSTRERYLHRVWSGETGCATPEETEEAARMFDSAEGA